MWTIWYEDSQVSGTTFTEWQSCPNDGVVAVYRLIEVDQFGNIGHVCMGSDWYWMLPNGEIGESLNTGDNPGEWTECNPPAGAHSKSGLWVSDQRMQYVVDALNAYIEG